MFGCIGRICRVDLTREKIKAEELSEGSLRRFFGGPGLGAKILFDELKPGINPLSPENKLIFATGPMTGAVFSGDAKYGVYAKSPLTEIFGGAHASGFFGPELKFAGYDAIIVEGKAETPVYLWIHDGETELRDASQIWGKFTKETVEKIRRETREERARIACIGPGGEKLVRFACVMNDLVDAAGRTGTGAVMGSKRLKAVAVRGAQKLKLADEAKFRELAVMANQQAWAGWGEDLHDDGTDGVLDDLNATGRLPTKNFREGTFEGTEKITGETMTDTILIERKACFGCGVGCKRVVEAKEPYVVDPAYGGPEYESTAALGSFCMNDNLVAIAKANELCNKYTIDTISTGVTIAFAMECYENGLLTKEDIDGLDPTWGNHNAILQLVEKIGKREGFGNLLAEGTKRAAERIGRGAERFAMQVKGLELPMHEPRGKKGLGLSYATSIRGGCHVQAPHDDYWGEGYTRDKSGFYFIPEIGLDPSISKHRLYVGPEKAKIVTIGQNWWTVVSALGICIFTPFPVGIHMETLVEMISSATGWDVTARELITVGERVWNLARAFNVREGITRKDDVLPDRFSEPLPDGLYEGQSISKAELEKLKDHYYQYRGWNNNGIPTREKLEELGLKYVADELEKLGKL